MGGTVINGIGIEKIENFANYPTPTLQLKMGKYEAQGQCCRLADRKWQVLHLSRQNTSFDKLSVHGVGVSDHAMKETT